MKKRGLLVVVVVLCLVLTIFASQIFADGEVGCCETILGYFEVPGDDYATEDECVVDGNFHDDPNCASHQEACCCIGNTGTITTEQVGCDSGTFHSNIYDLSTCQATCSGLSDCLETDCTTNNLDQGEQCVCGNEIVDYNNPYCCLTFEGGTVYDNSEACFDDCAPEEADGFIEGTVRSDDGPVIFDASVSVQGKVAKTDEDGSYSISGLTEGTYEVQVSAIGFVGEFSNVLITKTTNKDFDLTPLDNICGNGEIDSGEECDRNDDDCAEEYPDLYGTIDMYCAPPGYGDISCTCIAYDITQPPLDEPEAGDLCYDGIDNDRDNYVDECDKGCWSELNYDYEGANPIQTALYDMTANEVGLCNDNKDNDCDGKVDFQDNLECVPEDEVNVINPCGNSIDDDNDGAFDNCDTDCNPGLGQNVLLILEEYGPTENVVAGGCSDGLDNDCDGKIDCVGGAEGGDPDCNCEETETNCSDNVDNDGDGLYDCQDPDCNAQFCQGSNYCTELLAVDSNSDGINYDICCLAAEKFDCDDDGVFDSCGECPEDFCGTCGSIDCLGMQCDVANPSKQCTIEGKCEEVTANTISGFVYAQDTSDPIAGAKVVIGDNEIITNAQGGFYLIGIDLGSYTADATHPNYLPLEDYPVELTAEDNQPLIYLDMEPKPTYPLNLHIVEENTKDIIQGAQVRIDGEIIGNTNPSGNIADFVFQGMHQIAVTAQDYVANTVYHYVDNDLSTQALQIELKKAECNTDKVAPELNEINIYEGERKLGLSWTSHCNPEKVTLYKCENSPGVSTCDENYVNVVEDDTSAYLDTDVREGVRYCYKVVSHFADAENNQLVQKSSETKCVGPFNDPCLDQKGEYCFNDKTIYRCTTNSDSEGPNKAKQVRACQGDREYCYGPIDEEASCVYQSYCDECGLPFGVFSHIGTVGWEDQFGGQLQKQCEEIPLCFLDYTDTSVDAYDECADIMTCYDYKSQSACQGMPNLIAEGSDEDGSFNNKCLPRNCTWEPDPRYNEIGSGICREINETMQDCSLCDSNFHNEIYGMCDKTRCGLYGSCYYDYKRTGENAGEYLCTHKSEMSCEMYDTVEDCVGSNDLHVELDAIWEDPTTLLDDEFISSGTNEITQNSDDYLGFGVCTWGTPYLGFNRNYDDFDDPQPNNEMCYKDADFDRQIHQNNLDCNLDDVDCQKDMQAPVSYVDQPLLGCYGEYCSDIANITIFVSDYYKTSVGGFTSYYAINPEEGFVYPKDEVDYTIDYEFGDYVDTTQSKNYTVFFYSKDGSNNIEYPIKNFTIEIDPLPPSYNISVEEVPYVVEEFEDHDEWATNLTITGTVNNEKASCNAELLKLVGALDLSKKNPLVQEYTKEWKRFYHGLSDGYYLYNVSCRDLAGNVNNTMYPILVDADKSITDPQPSGTINYTDVTFSVLTPTNAECGYTLNSEVTSYDALLAENYMQNAAEYFPAPNDNLIKGYKHTKSKQFAANELHELKIVCKSGAKNNYQDLIFTIDKLAPEIKVVEKGTDNLHELQQWQLTHDFALKCYDERLPDSGGKLNGEPFGCANIYYCITAADLPNCNDFTEVEGGYVNVPSVSEPSMQKICYYAVDKGGNSVEPVCENIYVDNTPSNISIKIFDSTNAENYYVTRFDGFSVRLTSTEELVPETLSLSYQVSNGARADVIMTPVDGNNKLYEGFIDIPETNSFKNIEGIANNTRWQLSAFDLQEVETTELSIIDNPFFTLDTKGPDYPKIYVPNWEAYPQKVHNEPSSVLKINGLAADGASEETIRVYVTNKSFEDRTEARANIGTTDWTYVETTSLEESSFFTVSMFETSVIAGTNSLIVDPAESSLPLLVKISDLTGKYIEFYQQSSAMLANKTYYKITDAKTEGNKIRLTFTPKLNVDIPAFADIKIHDKFAKQGWFSVDLPLISGNNWVYAVAIDEYGNEGEAHIQSPFKVISDPYPPEVRIIEPMPTSYASGSGIYVIGEIEDNSGLDVSSVNLTVKKTTYLVPPIVETFSYTCASPEIDCENNDNDDSEDGDTNMLFTYSPSPELTNGRYELKLTAKDLVGGEGINLSWFEIDGNVPHEPFLEIEDAFLFSQVPYTDNDNPEMNISFMQDIGKDVEIESISLSDPDGQEVNIVLPLVKQDFNLPLDGTSTLSVNSFEAQEPVIFVYDDSGSNIVGFKAHKEIVNLINAQVKLTGLIHEGSFPSDVELRVDDTLVWSPGGALDATETIQFTSDLADALDDCEEDALGYCEITLDIFSATKGRVKIENLDIDYEISNKLLRDNYYAKYTTYLDNTLFTKSGEYTFTIEAKKETEEGWSNTAILVPVFYFDNTPPVINIVMANATMDTTPQYFIESDDPVVCDVAIVKQGTTPQEQSYITLNENHNITVEGESDELDISHLNIQVKDNLQDAPPYLYIEHPDYIDSDYSIYADCVNFFDMSAQENHNFYLVHPKQNKLFYRNGDTIEFILRMDPGLKDTITCDLSELDSNFNSGNCDVEELDNEGNYKLSYDITDTNEKEDGSYWGYLSYGDVDKERVVMHLHNDDFTMGLESDKDYSKAVQCQSFAGYFFNELNCVHDLDGLSVYSFRNSDAAGDNLPICPDSSPNIRCASIYYLHRNKQDVEQSVVLDDPCYNDQFCMVEISALNLRAYYNKYADRNGLLKVRFEIANTDSAHNYQIQNPENNFNSDSFNFFNCNNVLSSNAGDGAVSLTCGDISQKSVVSVMLDNSPLGLKEYPLLVTRAKDQKNIISELEFSEVVDKNQKASARVIEEGEDVVVNGFYPYCNDGVDNDLNTPLNFNYIGISGGDKADCRDSACDNKLVDTNKKCEYQTELSCDDGFDNDMDDPQRLKSSSYANLIKNNKDSDGITSVNAGEGRFYDCYDNDCYANDDECPSFELNCMNNVNDDFDFGSYGVEETTSLQTTPGGTSMIDCLDVDCDTEQGDPDNTANICHFGNEFAGYPLSCRDNFNNDADNGAGSANTNKFNLDFSDCYDTDCWRKGGETDDPINNPCPSKELNCNDDIDNDFDDGLNSRDTSSSSGPNNGKDCRDYDCAGNAACPVAENKLADGTDAPAQCFDSIDNDLDAYVWGTTNYILNTDDYAGIDCLDLDCNGTIDPDDETHKCEFGKELTCDDGFDNDGDGKTDEEDPDCVTGMCYPNPIAENLTLDSCANLENDDISQDNDVDCADTDCNGNPCYSASGDYYGVCVSGSCKYQATETDCNDGKDNDGDGKKDCLDSDCSSEDHCPDTGMAGHHLPNGVWTYDVNRLSGSTTISGGSEGNINVRYTNYIKKGHTTKIQLTSTKDHGFVFYIGRESNPLSNIINNDNYGSLISELTYQSDLFVSDTSSGLELAPIYQKTSLSSTFDFNTGVNVGVKNLAVGGKIGTSPEDIKNIAIIVLESVKPRINEINIKPNSDGVLTTVTAEDRAGSGEEPSGIYYCNFRLKQGTTLVSEKNHVQSCIWDYTDANLDYGQYTMEVDVYDGAGNFETDSETFDFQETKATTGRDWSFIDDINYFTPGVDDLEYNVEFESYNGFSGTTPCVITVYDMYGDVVETKNYAVEVNPNDNKRAVCSGKHDLDKTENNMQLYNNSQLFFTVSLEDVREKTASSTRNPFWMCEYTIRKGQYACVDECFEPLNITITHPQENEVFEHPLINVSGFAPVGAELSLYVNSQYRTELEVESLSDGSFDFTALALDNGVNTIVVYGVSDENSGFAMVDVNYSSKGPIVDINITPNGMPEVVNYVDVVFSIDDEDTDELPNKWEDKFEELSPAVKSDASKKYNATHTYFEYYTLTDDYDLEATEIIFKTKDQENDVEISKQYISDNTIRLTFPDGLAPGAYYIEVISIDKEGEPGTSQFLDLPFFPDAPHPVFSPRPPQATNAERYDFEGYIDTTVAPQKVLFESACLSSVGLPRMKDITEELTPAYAFEMPNVALCEGINLYKIIAYGGESGRDYSYDRGFISRDSSFEGLKEDRVKLVSKEEEKSGLAETFEEIKVEGGEEIVIGAPKTAINCLADYDCFIEQAEDCSKAMMEYNEELITASGYVYKYEYIFNIDKTLDDTCLFEAKIDDFDVDATQTKYEELLDEGKKAEDIQQILQTLLDNLAQSLETEKQCEFESNDNLTDMLTDIKNNKDTARDWDFIICNE